MDCGRSSVVEHLVANENVESSNLFARSIKRTAFWAVFFVELITKSGHKKNRLVGGFFVELITKFGHKKLSYNNCNICTVFNQFLTINSIGTADVS